MNKMNELCEMELTGRYEEKLLRVCRQNMNVLQTCAIWRENKDYKKILFYLSK